MITMLLPYRNLLSDLECKPINWLLIYGNIGIQSITLKIFILSFDESGKWNSHCFQGQS